MFKSDEFVAERFSAGLKERGYKDSSALKRSTTNVATMYQNTILHVSHLLAAIRGLRNVVFTW
jgi:hypothetical protein